MGKRPRTPHFITGLGDGNVGQPLRKSPSKQGFGVAGRKVSYIRKRASERLVRMEPPVDHWTDVFGNSASAGVVGGGDGIPRPVSTAGPWQMSAFCLLGMIVVLSAIFLHLVTDSGDKNRPNRVGAASRRVATKVKRKKTDEWSEDEEEQNSDGGAYRADNEGSVQAGLAGAATAASTSPHLYYPYQPRFSTVQEHRHRKPSVGGVGGNSAVATTKELGQLLPSNSNGMTASNASNTLHNRNYYVNQSGTAVSNFSAAPVSRKNSRSPRQPKSLLQNHLLPSTGLEGFDSTLTASESMGGERVTASNLEQLQSPNLRSPFEMVRQLSPVSSMASMEASSVQNNNHYEDEQDDSSSPHLSSATGMAFMPLRDVRMDTSAHSAVHRKTSSLELSCASDDFDVDETPRAGRYTRQTPIDVGPPAGLMPYSSLGPPPFGVGGTPTRRRPDLDAGRNPAAKDMIPFIPRLEENVEALPTRNGSNHGISSMAPLPPPLPSAPQPISVEELRLVQMETGNAPREQQHRLLPAYPGRAVPIEEKSAQSSTTPPDSGERNDPRKSIQHKRSNLTLSTDSASSLQSSIDFCELNLQEVIGGGGFGQVWKAMWRGTPVAVKVLTGTAQSKNVSKAILEEFAAEINLLKGMRHPNICLYMGACLEPPNRAIVTELAANGSVWDALRLPLAPPYVACDGVTRDGWPLSLYLPDSKHGVPPTYAARREPPIPPKGTWPWVLVKKVACGAARGMAYLHSGKPPVLHRDLKSANLLLDESYTTKVCDFGLSRLKSQNQSMTGNCGTVQWMAPEVLANQKYAESADVFSFGIIFWELLSRECPYDGMSAIQCALAVLHRGYRPEIPPWCPPSVSALIKTCLKGDPETRPTFTQIILALDSMP